MTTLHVVGLPHTQITREYSSCAYTSKVRRFVPMMENEGWDISLHGSLDPEEQKAFGFNGPEDYLKISFDSNEPYWKLSNQRAIDEIKESASSDDIVCLIGGDSQQPIVDALSSGPRCVEFGIGYIGVCRNTFKVFESNAWRNYVYGTQRSDVGFFDEVIPNYYEISDFPVVTNPDNYFAFVGRLIDKKGYNVAFDVASELGVPLVVAGQGTPPEYADYRGMTSIEETAQIMAHAKALFVPTTYVAPFEGVHIEANLCGTPVITTDQGVFTDTVDNGVNGYRAKMFRDFIEGAQMVPYLNRRKIAREARKTYSTEVVGSLYTRYFERIQTLSGAGWYS